MSDIKRTELESITKSSLNKALGAEGETVLIVWDKTTFEVKYIENLSTPHYILNVKRQSTSIPGYFIKVRNINYIIPELARLLLLWSEGEGDLFYD